MEQSFYDFLKQPGSSGLSRQGMKIRSGGLQPFAVCRPCFLLVPLLVGRSPERQSSLPSSVSVPSSLFPQRLPVRIPSEVCISTSFIQQLLFFFVQAAAGQWTDRAVRVCRIRRREIGKQRNNPYKDNINQ